MIIQHGLILLSEISSIENKISFVEKIIIENELDVDMQFLLKSIIKEITDYKHKV